MGAGWGKLESGMGHGSVLHNLQNKLKLPFKLNPPSQGLGLMTICFYSKYSLGIGGISPHTPRSSSKYLLPTTGKTFSEQRAGKYFFFFI